MSIGTQLCSVLRTTPKRYQIRGVRFLCARAGRAILGDDMGLGKTLQTIGWLALHPAARPALIVCPSSMKFAWQRELWTHARIRSQILDGRGAGGTPRHAVVIINYDILQAWLPTLAAWGPQLLVMDECQYVKSTTSKRTAACTALARQTPHVIALSGTPIVNRPVEFFPVLHMIAPGTFNSFWQYAWRYCRPRRAFRGRGWLFDGAANLPELRARVQPLMLRRMKEEVLTELPPKIRSVIPVDISNRPEYRRAEQDIVRWVAGVRGSDAAQRAQRAEALVRLNELRLLAAKGKLPAIIEEMHNHLDAGTGKLVVFAVHRAILAALQQEFPRAPVIHGGVGPRERQIAVDRFQHDRKTRLILGNIHAMGVGLTLHAADTAMFAELGWHPAAHTQAEDRIYRLGQTSQRVLVRYYVAKNTIEEHIMDVIAGKRKICGAILDGSDGAVVDAVLRSLTKETDHGR